MYAEPESEPLSSSWYAPTTAVFPLMATEYPRWSEDEPSEALSTACWTAGTSPCTSTMVWVESELLKATWSVTSLVTEAVLDMGPGEFLLTVAVRDTVALAPETSDPREHEIETVPEHAPWDVEEAVRVRSVVRASARTTFVAVAEPRFDTVIVYVRESPGETGLSEASLLTDRSTLATEGV